MSHVEPHVPHLHPRLALGFGLALAAATFAVLLLTNGQPSSVLSPSSPTAASANASTGVTMPLADRIVPASVFPGFFSPTPAGVVTSARAWVTTVEQSRDATRETQRLQGLGFTGGVQERLFARYPGQAETISIAERYRTSAGAQAELAYQRGTTLRLSRTTREKLSLLRSVGVPGAFGWVVRSGRFTGVNVMFASGPYYYLVGSGSPSGGAASPAHVTAGAQFLYLLVHGCVSAKAIGRDGWSRVVWSEKAGRIITR